MSVLLVESAVVSGPRAGVAGGMGVATVDFLFAAVAVAVGGAAGAALADHETQIHLVAAAILAAIAVHGLLAVVAGRRCDDAGGTARHGRRRASTTRGSSRSPRRTR